MPNKESNTAFYLDLDTVFEPVSQWQNFSGSNMLRKFFDDPKRWTGTFVSLSSLTRLRDIIALILAL